VQLQPTRPDGSETALDPLPAPEPARLPAYLIELASAPVDRVRWTYDRATLVPHTPTPAVRASNLIEFALVRRQSEPAR
jgi:hypothetical protein